MPDTYPVTLRNLNYSPIAVGLALILLLAAWFFPVYGVERWFRGKAHTLKDANLVRTAGIALARGFQTNRALCLLR